jgi:OOP family OmpA-OmpF porin
MMFAMLRGFAALLVLVTPAVAAADSTQLGAFLGPRIFSQHSALGYIDGEQAHPMLENSVAFGGRVGREFVVPWFFPELELAFSSTRSTTPMGAIPADIYWLDPRVQFRFELLPGRRVQPFVLIGGGVPIALSSKRLSLNSGVIGEGYLGAGGRINTDKGFAFRLDARFAIIPGENPPILGYEAEFNIGIDFHLGEKHARSTEVIAHAPPPDRDGDGIPDAKDQCPDRPEDMDGFEDEDGCPDIDNDGDHVLDIADKCPLQPETMNGFEDDDGCPDSVPPDVEQLKGTIEGLIYAEGETAVRDSAQPSIKKIAKIMADHPSIKVVLVGHTDDREAKAFVTAPEPGQPAPDLDSIATQLAHGRAEAVRQALVAAGAQQGKIVVDGVGAEDPVADNGTAKGRLANRRVEIKLMIPR